MGNLLRNEYPRPQMVRDHWECLNGEWEFAFDLSDSGAERGLQYAEHLDQKINVPFCPESELSGIGFTDFMDAVWYKKRITLTKKQLESRILLRFEACDCKTTVYCNGKKVGYHVGGYTPFAVELTDVAVEGENIITVQAQDRRRTDGQPHGKQCDKYASYACSYTRTTGIWQTVWLEYLPHTYIENYKVDTFPKDKRIALRVMTDHVNGYTVRASAFDKGELIASGEAVMHGTQIAMQLILPEVTLWEPGKPYLYDLKLELLDGNEVIDSVDGYFGMRSVEWHGKGVYINGKPVFLRTVLDQGFNPKGIYTAPSDAFLKEDILRSMNIGFNGARLHQRVFEQRFLYWSDQLGYLVFGEFANGSLMSSGEGVAIFMPQWLESIHRDYNHPSLIGWIPFNESYWVDNLWLPIQDIIYQVTKEVDPYRPCIDASGGYHSEHTDLYDVHDYEQDPAVLREKLDRMEKDIKDWNNPINRDILRTQEYGGQPYWISEAVGTFWKGGIPRAEGEFSYGIDPTTEEEFAERYEGLIAAMLDSPIVCGFCVTQLTDIEQECNGMYHYDRTPKFGEEVYKRIKAANERKAAFEK